MDYLDQIISLALAEDSGMGDITTQGLLAGGFRGQGVIVAKESMILAGVDVAATVFQTVDETVEISTTYQDGDEASKNDIVMKMEGDLAGLLKAERIALNFLQHLSGIATITRQFVKKLGKSRVRLVDTRKTTPGLRLLEKNAVVAGGGGL